MSLERLFRNTDWKLHTADGIPEAVSQVAEHGISVVLTESSLDTKSWRDLQRQLSSLDHPPHLIVTSRLADNTFWAEALEQGAFDVLAKPFEANEVKLVVDFAWLHWSWRHRRPDIPSARQQSAGFRVRSQAS